MFVKPIYLLLLISSSALPGLSSTQELAALCKVWGLIKYHHPMVADHQVDWDQVLINILEDFPMEQDNPKFNLLLDEMLGKAGVQDPDDSEKVVGNREMGIFSWLENGILSPAMREKLKRVVFQKKGTTQNVQFLQPVGNAAFPNEKSYDAISYPGKAMRLLALFRYWNVIQYFYPYKSMLNGEWEGVLERYIPRFANARNSEEYHLTVMELATCLQDGHASVTSPVLNQYFGEFVMPFRVKFIADQFVIYKLHPSSVGLEIGDIILAIDDIKINDLIDTFSPYALGSNQGAQQNSLGMLLSFGRQVEAKILVERDGQNSTHSVKRLTGKGWAKYFLMPSNSGSSLKKDDFFGYINMKNLKKGDIKNVFESYKEKRAIIIDIRNYPPFVLYEMSNFLNYERKPFAKISIPDSQKPGSFIWKPLLQTGPTVPNFNYFKGLILVLVDETTMSRGEFTTMALQTAPKVKIVGVSTAGTDGNVSSLPLPGGIIAKFSGTGVFYPDGRSTQGVGIIPDIVVRPTIEGLRMGRDEVLERAIQFIQN